METLKYVQGDATVPIGEGRKLIIHCCNDIGAWGAGFVMALSKKWDKPEASYRKWHGMGFGYLDIKSGQQVPFELGFCLPVAVESDIGVVNMIAQHETGPNKHGFPPVRYWALDECLKKVADLAKKYDCSVHGPKFGCGLAGGEWDYIELIIKKRLIDQGIDTTIYLFD